MIIFIFVKISIALNPLATKIKICLVTVTLSDGGAERVAAELSKYFDAQGYEVHHVVFSGKIEYDYKGKVHHLIDSSKNKILNKFIRLIKLITFFRNNKFNHVIDFRTKESIFQELIIHNLIFPNFIQTIHNYNLNYYFNKNKFLSRLMYLNCKRFICVSSKIKDKILEEYRYKNLDVIYNPIQFVGFESVDDVDYEYIIAAGRMHQSNVKQFDVIINVYAQSILPRNNVKLILIGDGDLLPYFKDLVINLNLQQMVVFKGFVENPYFYYKNAKFLVMASKHEGFPMVMIESLAQGTPVVSWDFNSGPSEIIHNFENGLLVKNQDTQALVQALNTLFEDKILYLHCKSNAKLSVRKFDTTEIGKQWEHLFRKS